MSGAGSPPADAATTTATMAPDAPIAQAAPIIERLADLDSLSRAATAEVLRRGAAAIAARGRFHLALSGGSTPRRLMQLLAAAGPGALPWERVELWWCDERAVPPEHPDSNYGLVRQHLIAPLCAAGVDEAALRLHRMRGEAGDLDEAAADYQRQLIETLGEPPVLDLAVLGLGPDGHTASLFPDSPALTAAAGRWAVANRVRSPLVGGEATRLTLTAATLGAARHALMLVAGADKAAALREVLTGPRDPRRYPAQLLADSPRPVQWLIDDAAAAALPG